MEITVGKDSGGQSTSTAEYKYFKCLDSWPNSFSVNNDFKHGCDLIEIVVEGKTDMKMGDSRGKSLRFKKDDKAAASVRLPHWVWGQRFGKDIKLL